MQRFEKRTEPEAGSDHINQAQGASERLRTESSELLGVRSPRTQSTTRDTRAEFQSGTYTIKSGDTLSSIAARMLKLRGEPVNGRSVYEEVDRIAYMNLEKYPWLAENPSKIKPGMKLVVWDRDSGPDTACKWKDWKEAQPGKVTVAQRCESVFAGKGSQVIVAPGGRAVFTPGSFGFIAPKGYARVLDGAHVMATGGDIVDDGGALQILHDETKVRRDRPRAQQIAQASTEERVVQRSTDERALQQVGQAPTEESPFEWEANVSSPHENSTTHEEAAALIKQGIDVPPV